MQALLSSPFCICLPFYPPSSSSSSTSSSSSCSPPLPLRVRLQCRAAPERSLAAAVRLCSRVASPSAGVWCRTKHEKNVIDVSAVAVRKSSTPATDTTPGRETEREKGRRRKQRGERQKGDKRGRRRRRRRKDVLRSAKETKRVGVEGD